MSNKQLQFELWEECGSKCTFCYLGNSNKFTSDELKINSLNNALITISNLDNYKEFDTLSYLGGEFFQGQMKNPLVKEKFMELMNKTVWLLNQEYVTDVWIYATLTIGNQKDLYDTLKLFEGHKGNLWILTSYDTLGRFHTQKMEDNWKYHMKHIHELYPDILFNITTILSEDCIDKYLSGQLSFQQMMKEYHCSFFFKQCGCSGAESLQEMHKRIPGFFPPRDKFLKFLSKFRMEESELMWDKLFNIKYRADVLYRNGNDITQQMQLNIRHKNSNKEIELQDKSPETELASCGHLKVYHAYNDCDGCVICDKKMIEDIL